MTTHDWFLFSSTFVISVLCGMYLYFTTFVPAYIANPMVQDIAAALAPNWTIAVRTYGGCAMSNDCPAFELTERRAYRYQANQQAPIVTGKVPAAIARNFSEVLEAADLDRLSLTTAPVEGRTCRSYVDGIDYSISVVYYGQAYELDTCHTQLPYGHALLQLVRTTFYYIESPEDYVLPPSDTTSSRGLAGYIERLLKQTFKYGQ